MTFDLTAIDNASTHRLPDWLTDLRPHQMQALQEIKDAFDGGAQLVWLDGPTGAGKTAIGECARRLMSPPRNPIPALYVCSGLTLQDQFLRDFPYAAIVKGRSNYPSELMLAGIMPEATADLCNRGKSGCWLCPSDKNEAPTCSYRLAKISATHAELAVLNTTYMLYEANGAQPSFSGRDLVIADECDELEDELLGYTEYRLSERQAQQLFTQIPKKGTHYVTIAKWLNDVVAPALRMAIAELAGRGNAIDIVKRRNRLKRLYDQTLRTAKELVEGEWVRDDSHHSLVLKPVHVGRFGKELLWRHGRRWLAMSATIISADQLAEDLGATHLRQAVVRVPMTFPVENRPIFFAPVADMSYKGKAEGMPRLANAIGHLLTQHEGERVLIHSVSYELTEYLTKTLRQWAANGLLSDRKIISYRNADTREMAVARYRRTPNAVIIAPSLDRGVDFRDDDCRVVIVAKVPFPSLGDKQVSARLHAPGGQSWYNVQTVRTLVQMTGRGVRSRDDHCVSYILDRNFNNVLNKNKTLLPQWWREAVNTRMGVRPLLVPFAD